MNQEQLPLITQGHTTQIELKYQALAKAVGESENRREILIRADQILRELNGWPESVGSAPINLPDCPF